VDLQISAQSALYAHSFGAADSYLSPVAIMRAPTDIFPSISIPVVAVAWNYTGLPPLEME
jgi:hypothetical protein